MRRARFVAPAILASALLAATLAVEAPQVGRVLTVGFLGLRDTGSIGEIIR